MRPSLTNAATEHNALQDDDGEWRLTQKPTRIQTTKKSVAEALHLRCQHDHPHCRLEGSAPGFGSRTAYMEDYQPGFAATLAAAISLPEPPHHWEVRPGSQLSEEPLVIWSNYIQNVEPTP